MELSNDAGGLARKGTHDMQITGRQQHQAWADRSTPEVEQIRDHVWSIPIDFGHAPIRYTFCYLITNALGEAVIVDPGGDSALGREQLNAGLARAGIPFSSIIGVVSTHRHLDHLGMVAFLSEATGAWIAMHERDAVMLDDLADGSVAIANDRATLAELGMPEERIGATLFSASEIAALDALARPTLVLRDGELLPLQGRSVRVVATPGHTPGHVCLIDEDEKLVFTGDHVLPRITPNIGMTSTTTSAGALADYYASLLRISEWDDHEAAPAHEYRFRGIAERAEFLADHHRERSREVLQIVRDRGPLSVWQTAEEMSWSRGWDSLDGINLRAALSEASAHVEYLIEQGDLAVAPDPASAVRLVTAAQ